MKKKRDSWISLGKAKPKLPRASSPPQTELNIQTGAEGRKNAKERPQDRNGEKDKIVPEKKSRLQSARGRTNFEESSARATQARKTQESENSVSERAGAGAGVGEGRARSPCTPVPRGESEAGPGAHI